jgi:hypothetical protein
MPQSMIGLNTLLFAMIVIHLSEAKNVQREFQAIVIIEKLNATSNGKHDVGIIFDR